MFNDEWITILVSWRFIGNIYVDMINNVMERVCSPQKIMPLYFPLNIENMCVYTNILIVDTLKLDN